jgi:hypothetical protein
LALDACVGRRRVTNYALAGIRILFTGGATPTVEADTGKIVAGGLTSAPVCTGIGGARIKFVYTFASLAGLLADAVDIVGKVFTAVVVSVSRTRADLRIEDHHAEFKTLIGRWIGAGIGTTGIDHIFARPIIILGNLDEFSRAIGGVGYPVATAYRIARIVAIR